MAPWGGDGGIGVAKLIKSRSPALDSVRLGCRGRLPGHCTGTTDVSDCPYSFYRTSGDIYHTWGAMLANLASTVPFLTGTKPLSRPGGWAYPDMLEVCARARLVGLGVRSRETCSTCGHARFWARPRPASPEAAAALGADTARVPACPNARAGAHAALQVGKLANFTESRSHFGAWAIMSSPVEELPPPILLNGKGWGQCRARGGGGPPPVVVGGGGGGGGGGY